MFFNTSCNEQVFSPKPYKNGANPSCRFRGKRKIRSTPTLKKLIAQIRLFVFEKNTLQFRRKRRHRAEG